MLNSPKQIRVQADWDKNSAQDLIHYDLKRLQSFAVTEHATFVLVRHCSLLVLEQLA